jgi:ABC-2 type transport system permease protein
VLKAYPTLLRIAFYEAVAYRAEFLVWMLSQTMPLVMLALTNAMAREAPLGRFDAASFTAYYLATLIVGQLTGAWVGWELMREIREGKLALRLLRPIHPLFSFSADSLAAIPMRAAVAVPIAVLLLLTAGRAHVTHDPAIAALFAVSLLGAWLMNFAVSAIIGTLSLFIESSFNVFQVWMGGFMVLSGYLLPLELFPSWLQRFARLTPYPYLRGLPVQLLCGLQGRESALRDVGIQWAWALGALGLLLILWRRGVKRFGAFGG